MNEARYQELLGRVLDDEINPAELQELSGALCGEPDRLADLQFHLVAWELFSQQRRPERGPESFVAAWRTRLAAETQASRFINRVAERLEPHPPPRVSNPRPQPASRRSLFDLIRLVGAQPWRAWTALAACAVLIAAVGVWWLGPTVGKPGLAEIRGGEPSLERVGQFLPTAVGMRLQSGDILRAPSNVTAVIGFAPENTRVTLQPGTELALAGMSHGKRLDLRLGKLEASVARQRPLRPMEITTPQAAVRVVGTRFTLAVTTNATRLDVTEGQVRLTRAADGSSVRVPGDHYAVVANATVLAALPQTGGLLREWWGNVVGKTRFALREEPRFPDRPESHDSIRDFELKLSETNRLGLRLRGYLHPPATGEYEFFLEYSLPGSSYAGVTMSPNENPADGVGIVSTGRTGIGATQAPPPVPLVAGRRYYIEAQVLINSKGEGHLALEWKPPKGSRELITSEFLSPFKTK